MYTDASYDQYTRHAAAAWWAKCDEGRLKHSVRLHGIRSSVEAEIMACHHAAKHVLDSWGKDYVTGISFNLDCVPAIRTLRYGAPQHQKYLKQQQRFNELLGGVYRRMRYVAGHQPNNSAQAWLNNWCDREAKIARKGTDK